MAAGGFLPAGPPGLVPPFRQNFMLDLGRQKAVDVQGFTMKNSPRFSGRGYGWQKDLPDQRDHSCASPAVPAAKAGLRAQA
jgi:hypothetical protein